MSAAVRRGFQLANTAVSGYSGVRFGFRPLNRWFSVEVDQFSKGSEESMKTDTSAARDAVVRPTTASIFEKAMPHSVGGLGKGRAADAPKSEDFALEAPGA